jgi:hypothetical protein
MKLEYTPEEYAAEIQRQAAQVEALAGGMCEPALNWQPTPKSWSVAQCLDHLVIMNRMYIKALQNAAETNEDQLQPRQQPMRPSGWFTRWFLGYEEPPPKLKLPAPGKIAPPSELTAAVVAEFQDLQQQFVEFANRWGGASLGELRVKDPLFPIHLTADTQLLVIAAHNRRHIWQAEQVTKRAGFPA